MPDSDQLFSTTPKDLQASPVGAGVAEPSDYPYFSHEKTLKWINETKEKLPRATPKMRQEAFLADPLLKGTIYPYLKNVLLKGFSIQTKDNKLYSAAIEEITDYLESLDLMQVFREDYLDFAILTGNSYRRMDPDKSGNIIRLEKIEPSSVEVYNDPWDSSVVAYHQHARIQKTWSKFGSYEDVDSWFIPYTLATFEIPITIQDVNATYIQGRGVGNNLKVFDLFETYKNKYNISSISNLRIAAAERVIAMHNTQATQKYNYDDDDGSYKNYNPAPIDSVILAIWLKRLLLVTSPNLIYAALSPFLHLISGVLKESKDNMGNPVIISSLPKKPYQGSMNYEAELANYNAFVDSINKAGKEVINSLKNGGVFVSGPDLALKPVESSRNVSFQLIQGLINNLNEEIGFNFGFPMSLVLATGTELASSRNILQIFNSVHAGERTEYEAVADRIIRLTFEGRTWQGITIDGEEEITVTYSFDDIKARFVLDMPDTKDLLTEAQTFKTRAETLTQIKYIGACREDLQALGEEYGFGLLGLGNFRAATEPDNLMIPQQDASAINAILKSCLYQVLQEDGLISKANPTAPSGFKEDKIVKKLQDAYETAQETILEMFDVEY